MAWSRSHGSSYTEGRCHFNFRWILDYGEGYISDWGAHYLDVAQWGHGTDTVTPVEITGSAGFPKEGLYDAPNSFDIEYLYEDGIRMICSTYEEKGIKFEGDEGWIHIEKPDKPFVIAEPDSILDSFIRPEEIHLPVSSGHHSNFIECVRSRKRTVAPVEIGHTSAAICHLGMTSAILGRKLKWNSEKEMFINDYEADKLLERPMREPWYI